MKTLEKGQIVSSREIRPGIWSMWVEAPAICREAKPGQFVHVRVKDAFVPLLRRPISIGRVRGDRLELVWRVVGEGTRRMTDHKSGGEVSLLGPLGHPFTIDPTVEHAVLVGGGLGLPPLVYLYEQLKQSGVDVDLQLGVRDRNAIPLADNDPVFEDVSVIAELGDGFRKGLVTELTSEILEEWQTAHGLDSVGLYSCGPWGLVGALQKTVPSGSLKVTEVSLEQQMGCGMGVCQGCAVRAEGGPTPYRLVCTDGPVFNLFQVEVPNGR